MAGTIPLSMTQQLNEFGEPLAGGKLYLIQAGTVSTPQNGYQDSALTLPWPNPIVLSASGRIPQFFLADGSIKIRLTNADGVEVPGMVVDGLIVTGASSGGGGGSPVDATTVLATGDIKVRYGTGILAGFVRLNGRTIGSSTSGGTERQNSDTQALFEYLWNNDSTLTVSTGRGASSAADWAANKTIALPDCRGRGLVALNDMGNTNAGIINPLAGAIQKGDTITLGSLMGLGTPHSIAMANLPASPAPVTATISTTSQVAGVAAVASNTGQSPSLVAGAGGNLLAFSQFGVLNVASTLGSNSANLGSGTTFDVNPAMMLITVYCKL